MIRFHLDENVSNAVAHGLRLRGIDVTTSSEAGLIGAKDLEQIKFAPRELRVVLTNDQDFLRHHDAGRNHAGVVYSRQGSRTVGEIVRFLQLLSDCLEPEDMAGQVEFF